MPKYVDGFYFVVGKSDGSKQLKPVTVQQLADATKEAVLCGGPLGIPESLVVDRQFGFMRVADLGGESSISLPPDVLALIAPNLEDELR